MEWCAFRTLLRDRFGHSLEEALGRRGTSRRWSADLDPRTRLDEQAAAWHRDRAVVRLYREPPVAVLDYNGGRYISAGALDAQWREFAEALSSLRRTGRLVLLDSPTWVRRTVHRAVQDMEADRTRWLTDNAATATNLLEEVGAAEADTAAYFAARADASDAPVVLADGVHLLSLRQQVALMRRLAEHRPSLVVLGGDTAGRLYHRAVDGWTLCSHAGRDAGVAVRRITDLAAATRAVHAALQAGPGLEFWCDPTRYEPPEPPRWHPVQSIQESVPAGQRRWVCVPVGNGRLVGWACQSLRFPAGAMTVVNYRRGRWDVTGPPSHGSRATTSGSRGSGQHGAATRRDACPGGHGHTLRPNAASRAVR